MSFNLKVQRTDRYATAAAIIESGLPEPDAVLTFIAYSDEMKARVLEGLASGVPYRVTKTQEEARDGEWFEPLLV